MRVLVASDALAGLEPVAASEVIARVFSQRGAEVAVVPLGIDGPHLAAAVAVAAPDAVFSPAHSSQDVGAVLAGAAGEAVILDLTRADITDLGRGALAPFGQDPRVALATAREAWLGRSLVALVPGGAETRPLTGLEGHASVVLREAGATLQEIIAADAAAERWAAELGVQPDAGAGAAGGLGLLVLAMGGRIVDPLTWLAERFGIADTLAQADLVVTGAEVLDFHARGGPVVKQVVAWAEEALRPVIALCSRNFVSSRELRLAGLEAAYALREGPGDDPGTPEELACAAERVARSWIW